MVLGWKNAPSWMKFGCVVVSIAGGIFFSKMIFGGDMNIFMMIFIATILFSVLHSIDATEWKFKAPSWKITYQTDLGFHEDYFDKNNWYKLGLTRIQSAWLFMLCLLKDDRDSYKVLINNKCYWVWGEQSKSYSVYYKMRDSKTFNTLPDGIYVTNTKGGRQYKPKNCQLYKMPSITEERLYLIAKVRYDEVERLEDIYNMLKIKDYKFLSKFKGKRTKFRTY